MQIYDRPVRFLLQEYAQQQLKPGQIFSKGAPVAWFAAHYPRIKAVTVKMHVEGMATNSTQRRHHPHVRAGLGWDLFYKLPDGNFRLWDEMTDPQPIYKHTMTDSLPKREVESDEASLGEDSEEPQSPAAGAFAYEAHLRDYLARNLASIEPGLRLYEEEGFGGVEFPVGGRYIDVLAVDAEGNFVVIELKVSRGYDRTLGQILRYMGWIEKNLAGGKQVRGVIVANEISEDLKLATSRIRDIRLMEYELSFKLKPAD